MLTSNAARRVIIKKLSRNTRKRWRKGDFDPIDVFEYEDGRKVVSDGYHRHAAALKADVKIRAKIWRGTKRDAILFAASANAKHGLRLSNDDKKNAVLTLLCDEEWRTWSNAEIVRRCGVSHTFVKNLWDLNSKRDPETFPPDARQTRKAMRRGRRMIQPGSKGHISRKPSTNNLELSESNNSEKNKTSEGHPNNPAGEGPVVDSIDSENSFDDKSCTGTYDKRERDFEDDVTTNSSEVYSDDDPKQEERKQDDEDEESESEGVEGAAHEDGSRERESDEKVDEEESDKDEKEDETEQRAGGCGRKPWKTRCKQLDAACSPRRICDIACVQAVHPRFSVPPE